MPFTGHDDYADASRRHLADAKVLLAAQRYDGAVHAAGFAAECALKAIFERDQGVRFTGKSYGHNLETLPGSGWAWTSAVAGSTHLRHALAGHAGAELAHNHPERRYWGRGWPSTEAQAAVEQATALVTAGVIERILDHGEPWGED